MCMSPCKTQRHLHSGQQLTPGFMHAVLNWKRKKRREIYKTNLFSKVTIWWCEVKDETRCVSNASKQQPRPRRIIWNEKASGQLKEIRSNKSRRGPEWLNPRAGALAAAQGLAGIRSGSSDMMSGTGAREAMTSCHAPERSTCFHNEQTFGRLLSFLPSLHLSFCSLWSEEFHCKVSWLWVIHG